MILGRFFEAREIGFYVDVGAHHPFRFSNTYLFFRKGWSGINIDAAPGAMDSFRRFRSRDINLEIGIGMESSTMPFYMFSEPALNTFDEELARERNALANRLIRTVDVVVEPLGAILKKHVPSGQAIDFLSVDVEGRDLEVLQSNDWNAFRPEIVVVETMSKDIGDLQASSCTRFLSEVGYVPLAKAIHSSFFLDVTKTS